MKNLSWIILFPLAVVLIVFAVSNRVPVEVDLWPLFLTLEIPLYILLFAALLAGVAWGGIAAWRSGGTTRKMSRARAREIRSNEAEIKRLKEQLAKLEADSQPVQDETMAVLPSPGKTAKALPPADAA